MFLYRYPKGMRTIGALPVGLTPITWQRFTPLNAASAITWSVLLVGAGYLFGQTIETAVVRGWGWQAFFCWSCLQPLPGLHGVA
jgi:membrane-associated protein